MQIIYLICLFLCSVLFTGLFRRFALTHNMLDQPNQRSSHTAPTPRGGGVVFCVLFFISTCLLVFLHWLPAYTVKVLALPAAIIAVLGYCDDIHGLPAKLRFAVQLATAMLTLYLMHSYAINIHGWLLKLGLFAPIFIILCMVWSTNLYNFMDGTDGLAGSEAVFIFGVGGLLLWLQGAHQLAYLCWILVAGVLGFLVWNWPRAKIFMGDVTSSFLGFLIIPIALIGYLEYNLSLFVWFILYIAFSFDATITLMRRIINKEKISMAHKSHAYQRLHQSGFSHKKLLLTMLAINSLLALIALAAWYTHILLTGWILLGVALYFVFYLWVEFRLPMYDTRRMT